MPSYFKTIADAAAAVLAALPGVPGPVTVRKDNAVQPREQTPRVVVDFGEERVIQAVSGAGTDTDQGDVLKEYAIGVSVYRRRHADVSTDLSPNADFVLAAKQALSKKTLAGAPSVYGTRLVDSAAWEHQPFGQGWEVSTFGVLFYSAETRLGN